MRRYPVEPLVEFSRLPLDQFRRRVSCSGSTWVDVRERGLTIDVADRWAVKLGIHAVNIWPEMLDDLIEAVHVPCAAPDCPVTFLPPELGKGQKARRYCSRRCQIRTNARRRYQEDAETRERRKAMSNRYRAEVRALREKREAIAS